MRKGFSALLIIMLLSALTIRVQMRFMDIESHLNRISKTDINHDYDNDGKTENTKQCDKLTKAIKINMTSTFSLKEIIQIEVKYLDIDFLPPEQFISSSHPLELIRPPIA